MYYPTQDQLVEKAILVGVKVPPTSDFEFQESLRELSSLVISAGAEVVSTVTQNRARIDPTFFVGKGKVNEIGDGIAEHGGNLVVFDDQLSPAQVRNLERELDVKVIDRGALILDIFGRRATTNEAQVQVELAQLEYMLPRLTRQWSHFSKHVGGIGTRGPGETQLESDRRLTRKRIQALSDRLMKIDRAREVQRRRRRNLFNVCLVGYTNAGKSTLFNALTNEKVWVENMLFCTLDSTSRAYYIGDGRKVIFTDTVGFIRKLPHQLVASFRATLDEVRYADLLVHVVDFAHPHYVRRISDVDEVLTELGAQTIPRITVFNKIDASSEAYLDFGQLVVPESNKFFISATKRIGLDLLIKRIAYLAENSKGKVLHQGSRDEQESSADRR
ncbi:MAG: GTPase HflX [Candidatus Zixiibacteriota bacterium]